MTRNLKLTFVAAFLGFVVMFGPFPTVWRLAVLVGWTPIVAVLVRAAARTLELDRHHPTRPVLVWPNMDIPGGMTLAEHEAAASPVPDVAFPPLATAPEPPPWIDQDTGEVITTEDQPQSSAGAEVPRPSPLPCPAKNPLAEPIEPPSAPVGPGAFVRWTKNGRDGLGQIIDVGTEAVEIRPFLPVRSNRVTVPLHSISTLTPNELAEALQ